MIVQHYKMIMPIDNTCVASPGQAVYPSYSKDESDEIIGFIWKYDESTRTADVVFFKPREMDILPYQQFITDNFPDAHGVFTETLKNMDPGVEEWWRDMLRRQMTVTEECWM
jgi:hypothetical protein